MSTNSEEYLEALHSLCQGGVAASTSEISRRLRVSPASVTEMLKKLSAKGYVDYSPYQGVTLTPVGAELAARMARRHRLAERFLHDVLHIGNDKVHHEACAMEHALSDETERALCLTLKAPDKCPDDGQLIPACTLGFKSCDECRAWGGGSLDEVGKRELGVVAVSTLKENQTGTVAFIRGDNKVLRRLLDMGLTPGAKIKVNRVAPLRGPVEIAVRGSKLALGDEVARNVFVKTMGEAAD
ncbi:MAG: metal-dependent transcriptional regulator [Dehalococcoidia bacterium]|nr:metal-dependent transcriptional regulator [Dehalococcoidia bacterium]